MRTNEELKQLAQDIHAGRIFTDRHLNGAELLGSVFLPLSFMDEAALTRMQETKVGMIFEYRDKAGPRSINGYPIFFSCQTATEEEAAKIWDYHRAIKEAVDSVKV